MHLTLSFSSTTLSATLWEDLVPRHHLAVPFRPLPIPVSTRPLFVALGQLLRSTSLTSDSALAQLGRWCDLGTVKTVNGTVPHPTALALPPTFPTCLDLDAGTPLQVQAPNIPIRDLFHPNAEPLVPRSAVPTVDKSALPLTSRLIPIGYLLSSLLLQSPGAVSPQETSLFRDFLSPPQIDAELSAETDQLLDFSVVDPAVGLGQTGSFWSKRYGLQATVYPFLPRAVAAYLTTATGPHDVTVIQDDIDYVVVQKGCQLAGTSQLPLPGVGKGTQVTISHDVNGFAARRLVRDKYANGKWATLGYLASRFAPGGSLGADNKLFAFAHPSEAPFGGTTRFEFGIPVSEFKDLRANARCVLESQILSVKSQVTEFGLEKPERIVLIADADNCAIGHLLAQVFATDVYAPAVRHDAISFGAAMLIINHESPECSCKSHPRATPPLTPSTTGTVTPPCFQVARPPKRPPSPSPSDPDTMRVRLISPKPKDIWEHQLYNAMMPEFLRLRNLISLGIVIPSPVF